ncbi:MAG: protein TolR [Myxococcota bacterium]|jgi:biopolymer transport protein TolR|nr:protein TolR [Myxococcota bacterium]
MGMSTGGGGRAMSEINVTPMVDVMLVLLIIFMVTAPFMQMGIEVDLPQAQAQSLDPDENNMILSVNADRKIFLGDTEIPREVLKEKLLSNTRLQADKEIFLQADRSLSYGFVIDIMAILKNAGVENLGMVTDPETTAP